MWEGDDGVYYSTWNQNNPDAVDEATVEENFRSFAGMSDRLTAEELELRESYGMQRSQGYRHNSLHWHRMMTGQAEIADDPANQSLEDLARAGSQGGFREYARRLRTGAMGAASLERRSRQEAEILGTHREKIRESQAKSKQKTREHLQKELEGNKEISRKIAEIAKEQKVTPELPTATPTPSRGLMGVRIPKFDSDLDITQLKRPGTNEDRRPY